jgi:hypothetical protein
VNNFFHIITTNTTNQPIEETMTLSQIENKMIDRKAKISHNGIKLKDQYQGDDFLCEVAQIINYRCESKIIIESLCGRARYIFIVSKNDNKDWLMEFKKVV